MNIIKYLPPLLLISIFSNQMISAIMITFDIENNCQSTLWAAAVPRGGGQQLEHGERWKIDIPQKTKGRIWGRTGCSFDATGRGKCLTGDCDQLLQCKNYSESVTTVVRYQLNWFNDYDFIDISLINGFNLPIKVISNPQHCTRPIQCLADINEDCPEKLRVPQGCSDPCAVFNKDKYCYGSEECRPNKYSRFFQKKCPNTYTYPKDDKPLITTCSAGSNYTVVFCP